jgi:site-specific DNA recombinase
MTYLIYSRVSTDKQSVETQNKLCLDWSMCQIDYKKHLMFEDPDTSSRIDMIKREGLQNMLSCVRKGDTVVVFKLDRFARDELEALTIYKIIEKKNARIFSLSEGFCESFMRMIYAAFALKEREDIGLRTKAKMQFLKSQNCSVGGIPYGKKLEKKMYRSEENKHLPIKIVDDLQEIAILKQMQRLKASGLTFREVTESLNAAKLFNRKGKPWNHASVFRILKNLNQI